MGTSRAKSESRNFDGAAISLLIAAVLFLFGPSVSFDFVNWDDPWYVIQNPLITSWRPANLWKILTTPAIRNYAPLTQLGYLIQHSLWGKSPAGYHAVNVLLHALNASLVFWLLRGLTGSRSAAITSALLFAVHPLQVETVAWVSSFKGLLSAAFILASLICWLRPAPTARQEAWGLVFHLCGLLSKALGITVPAITISYDVLVNKKRLSDSIARQLLPVVMGALVLLVTMSAQTSELGGVRGHFEWSKARILAVDSYLVWKYVGLLVWPHDLCVLYDPVPSGIGSAIFISAFGWIGIATIATASRKKYPLAVVGLIAFFALLFPVLNIFPITTLMNDRYMYLSSIPLLALLAGSLKWLAEYPWKVGRPHEVLSRAVSGSLAALLVLGYAVATNDRLKVWSSDRALWADALEKSGNLPVVRIQWATSLHNSHDDRAAVAVLQRTLSETNPDAADRRRILDSIREWSEPHTAIP